MKTIRIIAFTLAYYAALIAIGIHYGFKALILAIFACCCVCAVTSLIADEDREKDEQEDWR